MGLTENSWCSIANGGVKVRGITVSVFLTFFKKYLLSNSYNYTFDPKVVGSNPGGAKIGLYVFHNSPNWHEYWSFCSHMRQSSRVT